MLQDVTQLALLVTKKQQKMRGEAHAVTCRMQISVWLARLGK
jgi:hypothetical protein